MSAIGNKRQRCILFCGQSNTFTDFTYLYVIKNFFISLNVMNRKLFLLLFPILVLFAFGCDKEDPFQPDFKYGYFPLETGFYAIYDVDSIFYDDFFTPTKVDSTSYQIREYIESTFTDLQGREAFRIERYRRDSPAQSWQVKNVWFAVRTATAAERVEDNLRFIKLTFPPRVNERWEGNQFIETKDKLAFMDGWEYEYLSIDEPHELNGHFFDSTLTVFQRDRDVLTEWVFAKEMYAKNVGLIFREWKYLKKQDVTVPWSEARSGFIYRKKIAEFGYE